MTGYTKKITKISKGQVSSKLIERTDIGLLDTSAQVITNFRPSKFGGIYSSKGTKYLYTIGNTGTEAKKYKVSLPNGEGRTGLIINFTAQTMYLIDRTGVVTSNQLDVSDYFDEDTIEYVRIAQQGNLIIISSRVNPLLELTITKVTGGYTLAIAIFDIDGTAILKATTINNVVQSPKAILLAGALPTDTSAVALGTLYLPTAPTPPSATFPWTLKRYDGMDTATPPAAIWTDKTYTATIGDTVQYQSNSVIYAWNGTAWAVVTNTYIEDTEYTQTITPSAASGIVTVNISSGFSITAPSGQDPLTYARNKLCGIWLEGKNTPSVCYIQDIKTSSVAGQVCSITALTCYTLISFIDTSATTGFTIKFSMQRAFDVDYAGTSKNPEGTTNFPLAVIFYQQRLIIAGTQGDTMQMLFSKQGIYNDFASDYSGNNAFQLRLGGTEQQTIQNVIANQGIQIYTDIAEWIINDAIISAASGFTNNSETGSNGVQPIISANGTTLFCPKDGLGLIGFIYSYENANFATPPISILTDIYNNAISDLILKKSNSPNSDNLIFSTLENGKMVVGNYLSDQQIQAFTGQYNTGDYYKQSLQIEDDLFFIVERNGKIVLEIEDEDKPSFCCTSTPTYSNTTGIISGISLYNGKTINIYDGNGDFVESGIVAAGAYTIVRTIKPTTVGCIGYNIHSTFTSNPINVGKETFALTKSIRKIDLVITDDTKSDYITINGKKGRRSGNLLTFTKVSKPLRECTYTIENDKYLVDILSIDIDYEA